MAGDGLALEVGDVVGTGRSSGSAQWDSVRRCRTVCRRRVVGEDDVVYRLPLDSRDDALQCRAQPLEVSNLIY